MKYRPFTAYAPAWKAILAAILCVFLHLAPAVAETIVLTPRDRDLNLNGLLEHRVDRQGELSAATLLESPASEWDRNGHQAFGYTSDVHWFRVQVARPAEVSEEWVLELGRPFMDDVRVYVGDGRDIAEYRLGDHIPVADRPLATRMMVLPLPLAADRVTTILVRTQTTSATALTITLSRPLAFAARESREGMLYGGFYGIYVVVILFHLVIGGWIGDRVHVVYAVFAFSQMISYLFINGYGQVMVNQSWPYLNDRVVNVTNFTSCFMATWLWIEILRMKQNFPRLYRLYQGVAGVFLLALAVGWGGLYPRIAPPAFYLIASMSFLSLAASVDLLRRHPNHRTLWFFTPGFAVVCLALCIHVSALLGFIPLYLLPENLHQISALTHLSLLSVGLIHRVRDIERERTSAREEAITASARADGQRSLVAMLSHEFRTPLAMINSAAQMIRFREEDLATGSHERLNRIEDTARRLAALIDVFLAGDAIDQGKIVLNPSAGDVSVLTERVLGQFGSQARRVTVLPFQVPPLRADHDLLAVALRNCLANALSYSPADSPVRLRISETNGVFEFSVEDEGPGIPSEELEHLGTPYFRGSQASARSGSGLGISMVRTIVQAHGGAMSVESALGAGTRISLRLRDLSAPVRG